MVRANIERLPGHLHRRPDVHAVRMTKLLPIFALTSKLVDVDPVIGCQLWSNWQQNTPYPSTRAVHTDTTEGSTTSSCDMVCPGGSTSCREGSLDQTTRIRLSTGQSPAPDPTLYTSYRCLCST